jgi:hypothetical protein
VQLCEAQDLAEQLTDEGTATVHLQPLQTLDVEPASNEEDAQSARLHNSARRPAFEVETTCIRQKASKATCCLESSSPKGANLQPVEERLTDVLALQRSATSQNIKGRHVPGIDLRAVSIMPESCSKMGASFTSQGITSQTARPGSDTSTLMLPASSAEVVACTLDASEGTISGLQRFTKYMAEALVAMESIKPTQQAQNAGAGDLSRPAVCRKPKSSQCESPTQGQHDHLTGTPQVVQPLQSSVAVSPTESPNLELTVTTNLAHACSTPKLPPEAQRSGKPEVGSSMQDFISPHETHEAFVNVDANVKCAEEPQAAHQVATSDCSEASLGMDTYGPHAFAFSWNARQRCKQNDEVLEPSSHCSLSTTSNGMQHSPSDIRDHSRTMANCTKSMPYESCGIQPIAYTETTSDTDISRVCNDGMTKGQEANLGTEQKEIIDRLQILHLRKRLLHIREGVPGFPRLCALQALIQDIENCLDPTDAPPSTVEGLAFAPVDTERTCQPHVPLSMLQAAVQTEWMGLKESHGTSGLVEEERHAPAPMTLVQQTCMTDMNLAFPAMPHKSDAKTIASSQQAKECVESPLSQHACRLGDQPNSLRTCTPHGAITDQSECKQVTDVPSGLGQPWHPEGQCSFQDAEQLSDSDMTAMQRELSDIVCSAAELPPAQIDQVAPVATARQDATEFLSSMLKDSQARTQDASCAAAGPTSALLVVPEKAPPSPSPLQHTMQDLPPESQALNKAMQEIVKRMEDAGAALQGLPSTASHAASVEEIQRGFGYPTSHPSGVTKQVMPQFPPQTDPAAVSGTSEEQWPRLEQPIKTSFSMMDKPLIAICAQQNTQPGPNVSENIDAEDFTLTNLESRRQDTASTSFSEPTHCIDSSLRSTLKEQDLSESCMASETHQPCMDSDANLQMAPAHSLADHGAHIHIQQVSAQHQGYKAQPKESCEAEKQHDMAAVPADVTPIWAQDPSSHAVPMPPLLDVPSTMRTLSPLDVPLELPSQLQPLNARLIHASTAPPLLAYAPRSASLTKSPLNTTLTHVALHEVSRGLTGATATWPLRANAPVIQQTAQVPQLHAAVTPAPALSSHIDTPVAHATPSVSPVNALLTNATAVPPSPDASGTRATTQFPSACFGGTLSSQLMASMFHATDTSLSFDTLGTRATNQSSPVGVSLTLPTDPTPSLCVPLAPEVASPLFSLASVRIATEASPDDICVTTHTVPDVSWTSATSSSLPSVPLAYAKAAQAPLDASVTAPPSTRCAVLKQPMAPLLEPVEKLTRATAPLATPSGSMTSASTTLSCSLKQPPTCSASPHVYCAQWSHPKQGLLPIFEKPEQRQAVCVATLEGAPSAHVHQDNGTTNFASSPLALLSSPCGGQSQERGILPSSGAKGTADCPFPSSEPLWQTISGAEAPQNLGLGQGAAGYLLPSGETLHMEQNIQVAQAGADGGPTCVSSWPAAPEWPACTPSGPTSSSMAEAGVDFAHAWQAPLLASPGIAMHDAASPVPHIQASSWSWCSNLPSRLTAGHAALLHGPAPWPAWKPCEDSAHPAGAQYIIIDKVPSALPEKARALVPALHLLGHDIPCDAHSSALSTGSAPQNYCPTDIYRAARPQGGGDVVSLSPSLCIEPVAPEHLGKETLQATEMQSSALATREGSNLRHSGGLTQMPSAVAPLMTRAEQHKPQFELSHSPPISPAGYQQPAVTDASGAESCNESAPSTLMNAPMILGTLSKHKNRVRDPCKGAREHSLYDNCASAAKIGKPTLNQPNLLIPQPGKSHSREQCQATECPNEQMAGAAPMVLDTSRAVSISTAGQDMEDNLVDLSDAQPALTIRDAEMVNGPANLQLEGRDGALPGLPGEPLEDAMQSRVCCKGLQIDTEQRVQISAIHQSHANYACAESSDQATDLPTDFAAGEQIASNEHALWVSAAKESRVAHAARQSVGQPPDGMCETSVCLEDAGSRTKVVHEVPGAVHHTAQQLAEAIEMAACCISNSGLQSEDLPAHKTARRDMHKDISPSVCAVTDLASQGNDRQAFVPAMCISKSATHSVTAEMQDLQTDAMETDNDQVLNGTCGKEKSRRANADLKANMCGWDSPTCSVPEVAITPEDVARDLCESQIAIFGAIQALHHQKWSKITSQNQPNAGLLQNEVNVHSLSEEVVPCVKDLASDLDTLLQRSDSESDAPEEHCGGADGSTISQEANHAAEMCLPVTPCQMPDACNAHTANHWCTSNCNAGGIMAPGTGLLKQDISAALSLTNAQSVGIRERGLSTSQSSGKPESFPAAIGSHQWNGGCHNDDRFAGKAQDESQARNLALKSKNPQVQAYDDPENIAASLKSHVTLAAGSSTNDRGCVTDMPQASLQKLEQPQDMAATGSGLSPAGQKASVASDKEINDETELRIERRRADSKVYILPSLSIISACGTAALTIVI